MKLSVIGRKGSISQTLKYVFEESDREICLLSHDEVKTPHFDDCLYDSDLALLVLIELNIPSPQFISTFRDQYPEIPLIGLHQYKSRKLANSLIDSGLNGYLYFTPGQDMLSEAIHTILQGKAYLPDDLY